MSTTDLSSDWDYIRDKVTASAIGFVLEFYTQCNDSGTNSSKQWMIKNGLISKEKC